LALSVWVVFVVAFATALATGLGAVPLLLLRGRSDSWLGLGNAIAAGMMTAATMALLYEGGRDNVALTIAGVAVGAVFMIGARRVASHRHTLTFGSLRDADAVAALAIVGAMTIHSFTEGAGVGVSFGGGETLGFLIAIAIAVHNIPEGLAVASCSSHGARPSHVRLSGASSRAFRSRSSRFPPFCSSRSSDRCCRSGSGSQAARCYGSL
jgi:ZIP family zinc transporter